MFSLSTITAREPVSFETGSPDDSVHVTIIYDNYQSDAALENDWGFACLIEYQGRQLLFDAGRKADLYEKNVTLLGMKPQEIPSLFISHEHGDHTAGITWITDINPSVKLYLPASYAEDLSARGKLPPNSLGLSEPTHLYGPYYSTGDSFEKFREQGLVIKTETGGILITGCGHPGAIEMVSKAKEELGIEIKVIIGGLHLMQTSKDGVYKIAAALKELGV